MSDLISRQAAIDAILQRLDALKGLSFGTSTFRDGIADGYARIMSDLKALPPVDIDLSDYSDRLWRNAYEQGKADAEPERKRGKWVYNSPVTMKCDQCGHVIADWDWYESNYCPNCGADMRGDGDAKR